MSAVEQQGVALGGLEQAELPVARANRRRRMTPWSMSMRVLGIALVAALLLFMVGPLVWLMLRAFSGLWQFPQFLPSHWTLQWWRSVFDDKTLGRSIRLSFEFAIVVTILSSLICLPATACELSLA